jgi:hypothetical protein
MPTILNENYQRFTFGDSWSAFRCDGHESGYREITNAAPHTSAVDFLGVWDDVHDYLIEVKDFRGFRIQNKYRLTTGELAAEIASKVVGTLACIAAGKRRGNAYGCWDKLLAILLDSNGRVNVVLWLEDDIAHDIRRWQAELAVQTQMIKQRLRWLNVKVLVVSQTTYNNCPPELQVANLPGAGQPHP